MGRWANIKTVDEMPVWVSASFAAEIRKAAAEIKRRTDAHTYIDVVGKMLCFGYDRGRGLEIVFDIPMFRDKAQTEPMRFDPMYHIGVDDVVRIIHEARKPMEEKLAEIAAAKKRREDIEAAKVKNDMAEAAREGWKQTEYQYSKPVTVSLN